MTLSIDAIPGVIAHWDAGAITGLIFDDPVSTLPDTIAAWDMTGATTTRPLYKPTGINSLPAVQFDGTDDYLVTGSTKSITAPNMCSVAVVYFPTNKDYSTFGALSSSSGVPSYYPTPAMLSLGYSTGNVLLSSGANYVQGVSIVAAAPMLLTGFVGDLEFQLKRNGKFSGGALTGSVNPFTSGSYYAGFGRSALAGSAFHGMLAEWVLFPETILSEHSFVEGVLAHKYGITLPTSHPFYAAPPTSAPSSGGGVARLVNGGLIRGQVL